MIKRLAWNTFKNTGSIDTYLELVQMKNLENNKQNIEENLKVNVNGDYKNEGNSYFRK